MPVFRLPRRWPTRLGLCAAPALAVGLVLLFLYLSATTPLALASSAEDSLVPDSDTSGLTVFTRQDGLAANGVTALLHDDTVLWVGTIAGLSRYTLRGHDAGLAWQTFSQDDGMASDAITDLWSDDTGALWIAHPDGQISFFDGDAWTTYDSVTQTLRQAYRHIVDAQAAGPWWAIEEGGRVWTLSEGTVGYYVGAVWRPYGEDAGIPRGKLVAVWTGDGAWVASETGQIGYFDGANWTTFRSVFDAVQSQYETITASGSTAGPLWVVDQEGAVWVRNAFNQRNPRPDVRRFADGRWTNFGSGDGMADGFVAELRLDRLGRVWARHVADVNGQGGGLSLYSGEPSDQRAGASSWTAIAPAFSGNVTDFWPDGTDGVWIGSFFQPETGGVPVGGLTYVALNAWERFSLEALDGATVSDTWVDENDTLWLSLSSDARRGLGGGLWRYHPAQGIRLARWTQVTGLLDDDVRDLWGDNQGNLWLATAGGVNRITLKNRKLFSYTQSMRPDRIAGDAEGNVWAVGLGEQGGVWGWDGTAWADYAVGEGLSGGVYADMRVSADGWVYLAGDRGLDTWDGDTWDTFSALPGRHVRRIWQDSAGDLWLSSEITPGRPFNLSLNRGTTWETVLNESGSRGMGSEPLALLRDNQGWTWLGAPLGLFVYEPDGDARWRGLGPVEGLAPGPVPALYKDADGTVWAGVGEQVYRADHVPCGFGRAQSSTQAPAGGCWDWHRFEPQVGAVSQITAGPEGSVLFAGDAGIALYRPNRPDLRLEGVVNLISGEVSDGREPVVLTTGRNAMRVDLVAVAPTLTARQISYRYRLEGADEDWRFAPARSLGGKQASIVYAGLPGGVYTFSVAARTDALDYGPEISLAVYVLSRSPELVLDTATVAGRPAEQPGALRSYVGQPVQFRLSSIDDQLEPLTLRYRIEGLGDNWTETIDSEISFTLSAAGTYTLVAMAVDDEGQSSPPIGSQIVVSERKKAEDSTGLSVETIAAGMGVLAALFICTAVVLIIRRRRRESW